MRDLILIEESALPTRQVFGRDIAIKRYQQSLGITQGDVYWDASGGLHPNAFAGIAGSIQDNHNLYLYLPQHYPDGDPDHRQMLDYARPIALAKPYFNQRLRALLNAPTSPATTPMNSATSFALTPQVILGKRGRGKSTWLAQKIRWLLTLRDSDSAKLLLVTSFAAHRQRIVSLLTQEELANIVILPPDEASRLRPQATHLIIDEAATLPANQLFTLTTHYPSFSLASSEDGYEGSGRFFSLQTLPALKRQYPQLAVITLHEGQRFLAQDRLENRIEQLFFPHATPRLLPIHSQDVTFQEISPTALFKDEQLLREVYQLLFEGHYKTQPSDLKRLLDMPDQHIFVAFKDAHPIAVLHVLIEHPLASEIAHKVMHNIRRPQGRLLMQQLLLHTQQLAYASEPLARIQRIVTKQEYRRQSLASQLIQYALQAVPYPFGVSYGSSKDLDAFWSSQGFYPVFRSPKLNARTGRYNVIQLHKK